MRTLVAITILLALLIPLPAQATGHSAKPGRDFRPTCSKAPT